MDTQDLQLMTDTLEKGARMYKMFTDGVELAAKLRNLAQVEKDLLAAVDVARVKEVEAKGMLALVADEHQEAKDKAAAVLSDAKAKAVSIVQAAEVKSVKIIAKQDAEIRAMEDVIADTASKVQAGEVALKNLDLAVEAKRKELETLELEIEATRVKFKQLLG